EEYSDKRLFEEYTKQKDILVKYFNYLYDNDLIFCTDEPHNFPNILTTKYPTPNLLDFLSIVVDTLDSFKLDIMQDIDELGIRELILIQNNLNVDNIIQILKLCKNSKITSIIIITPYSEQIQNKILINIIEKNLRVLEWIFYDTKITKDIHPKFSFRKGCLKDILCKRIKSINDFVINTSAYIEAINYNLYFYKRGYIDDNGQVKHSLDDPFFYGNIQEKKLPKIISTERFQELWKVTKAHIKECRNCEFRPVCPDNRIPKKTGESEYEHITTCQYNPHT